MSGWGDIFCCCEKGVNASERVQRTVGALVVVVVVAPVSWDCAYGVAVLQNGGSKGLRTGQVKTQDDPL